MPDVWLRFRVIWLFWICKPVCKYHPSLLNYLKTNQTYIFAFSNTNIFYQKSKVEAVASPKEYKHRVWIFWWWVWFVISVFIKTCCEQGTNKSVCGLSLLESGGASPAHCSCLCPLGPAFSPHTSSPHASLSVFSTSGPVTVLQGGLSAEVTIRRKQPEKLSGSSGSLPVSEDS